jgi:hypothetical protein
MVRFANRKLRWNHIEVRFSIITNMHMYNSKSYNILELFHTLPTI